MKDIAITILIFSLISCNHTAKTRNQNSNIIRPRLTHRLVHQIIDTIEGIYSSASSNKIVYIKPQTWEADEVNEGTLFIRDVKSRRDIKVLDSVDAYNSLSSPIDDSSFIVCTNRQIYRYNNESSGKNLICQLPEGEYIEGLTVSRKFRKLALIAGNLKTQNAFLYLIDVDDAKMFLKAAVPFTIKEGEETLTCSINWVNDVIVFNVNNNLYLLHYNNNKINKLTDKLAYNTTYQFALDSNTVIYFDFYGENANSLLRYYNIEDNAFGSAAFNLKSDSLKVDFSNLVSADIDNKNLIFLRQRNKIFQYNRAMWKGINRFILYKNNNIEILENAKDGKKYIIVDHLQVNYM